MQIKIYGTSDELVDFIKSFNDQNSLKTNIEIIYTNSKDYIPDFFKPININNIDKKFTQG